MRVRLVKTAPRDVKPTDIVLGSYDVARTPRLELCNVHLVVERVISPYQDFATLVRFEGNSEPPWGFLHGEPAMLLVLDAHAE